jgi:serine/threonine-protein kinase
VDERFGPYVLQELIGHGGMGEVYRAFDTVRKRTVALKRLPSNLASDAVFQARFRRESEVAARLTDEHVIPIHDFGEIDGRLFIDMRYVEAKDLGTIVEENGPLAPLRAVKIVSQVAAALDSAHAEGLIHRDVKPSNILLRDRRQDDFVYLIDFGIARGTDATNLTLVGATVGTMSYMAPERFLEPSGGDRRVDVYALGCLLYETLTGHRPFPGEELPIQMYAHLNTPPPRPSLVRPAVPAGLDEVVARAMAKNPSARYASAGELAAAAEGVVATPAPPPREGVDATPADVTRAQPAPTGIPSLTDTSLPAQGRPAANRPAQRPANPFGPPSGISPVSPPNNLVDPTTVPSPPPGSDAWPPQSPSRPHTGLWIVVGAVVVAAVIAVLVLVLLWVNR